MSAVTEQPTPYLLLVGRSDAVYGVGVGGFPRSTRQAEAQASSLPTPDAAFGVVGPPHQEEGMESTAPLRQERL